MKKTLTTLTTLIMLASCGKSSGRSSAAKTDPNKNCSQETIQRVKETSSLCSLANSNADETVNNNCLLEISELKKDDATLCKIRIEEETLSSNGAEYVAMEAKEINMRSILEVMEVSGEAVKEELELQRRSNFLMCDSGEQTKLSPLVESGCLKRDEETQRVEYPEVAMLGKCIELTSELIKKHQADNCLMSGKTHLLMDEMLYGFSEFTTVYLLKQLRAEFALMQLYSIEASYQM